MSVVTVATRSWSLEEKREHVLRMFDSAWGEGGVYLDEHKICVAAVPIRAVTSRRA